MKKQTGIVKKYYQRLDKAFGFDKKKGDETINKDDKEPTLKKCNKSDLIYDSKHSFCKYHTIKKFYNLSLQPKYSFLVDFFNDLDKFSNLKTLKEKNTNVYDTASELHNDLLETCFGEYNDLSDAKGSKMDPKYDPTNLALDK